jgi:Na+/phosphate symporter
MSHTTLIIYKQSSLISLTVYTDHEEAVADMKKAMQKYGSEYSIKVLTEFELTRSINALPVLNEIENVMESKLPDDEACYKIEEILKNRI